VAWKIATIIAASFVSFTQGSGPLALAPMFPEYIEAFDCSLADAVQFTGVSVLCLGFSNFIWYVHYTDGDTLGSPRLQGSPQYLIRAPTCFDLFSAGLLRILYLESALSDLW
jgi:hypothetical protein